MINSNFFAKIYFFLFKWMLMQSKIEAKESLAVKKMRSLYNQIDHLVIKIFRGAFLRCFFI